MLILRYYITTLLYDYIRSFIYLIYHTIIIIIVINVVVYSYLYASEGGAFINYVDPYLADYLYPTYIESLHIYI